MEGWYVRKLILDRINIKSRVYNIVSDENTSNNDYILEDDTYLDLLTVESKINFLQNKGIITKKESKILGLLLNGKSYSDVVRILGISRSNVIYTFNNLCNKISYYLGDHFTNEGYINYIIEKYSLDNSKIELLRRYVNND